jgi:hypothetical protein
MVPAVVMFLTLALACNYDGVHAAVRGDEDDGQAGVTDRDEDDSLVGKDMALAPLLLAAQGCKVI